MPKLWNETIESHRREVREAIVKTTADIVAKQGLLGVTMTRVAEGAGIGRATLYKYFPDVEAILLAWHEEQIGEHLRYLGRVRDETPGHRQKLTAVLEAYAFIVGGTHGHHDGELAAVLHRDPHVARTQHEVFQMIRELIEETAAAKEVRDDIPPDELARYCLHALTAASELRSKTAIGRLVALTLGSLKLSGDDPQEKATTVS